MAVERRPEIEGQGIGRLGLPSELATFQAVPTDAIPDTEEIASEVADATMPGHRELNLDGVDMSLYTAGMGTKSAAERLRADNEAKRKRLQARRAILESVGQVPEGSVATRQHSKEARKIREVRKALAAKKSVSEGKYNGRILPEAGDPVSLRINTSGVPADWGDVNLDGDNYPGFMISGVAASEYVGSVAAATDIEIALSEAQPDVAPALGIAPEKTQRSQERRGMFKSGIVRRDQSPVRDVNNPRSRQETQVGMLKRFKRSTYVFDEKRQDWRWKGESGWATIETSKPWTPRPDRVSAREVKEQIVDGMDIDRDEVGVVQIPTLDQVFDEEEGLVDNPTVEAHYRQLAQEDYEEYAWSRDGNELTLIDIWNAPDSEMKVTNRGYGFVLEKVVTDGSEDVYKKGVRVSHEVAEEIKERDASRDEAGDNYAATKVDLSE